MLALAAVAMNSRSPTRDDFTKAMTVFNRNWATR